MKANKRPAGNGAGTPLFRSEPSGRAVPEAERQEPMLSSLLSRWLQSGWERLTVGEHLGIAFVDTSHAKHARQAFVARTTEALDLIQRVDSRRFKRIREHIKYTVHQELPYALGRYDQQFRACYVDFTRLNFSKHPGRAAWGYAAALVHEATHGRIRRFGIPSSRRTRERVEHLCDAEAAHFLRRYSDSAADDWNDLMNRPERHEEPWAKTLPQRVVALWKRRHGGRMTSRIELTAPSPWGVRRKRRLIGGK